MPLRSKLPFKEDFPAHLGIVGSLLFAVGAFLPSIVVPAQSPVNSFNIAGFGEMVIALASISLTLAVLQSHAVGLAIGVGGVVYIATKFAKEIVNGNWNAEPRIGLGVLLLAGLLVVCAGFLGVRRNRRELSADA